MTTTFITGANKGLGYETARRLIAVGHTVYLGARNPAAGPAQPPNVSVHDSWRLDVTDDFSVTAAAKSIDGTWRTRRAHQQCRHRRPRLEQRTSSCPRTRPPKRCENVFDTNVFGVVRVTHAFLPLLEKSHAPVVVNVSSRLGLTRGLSIPASDCTFFYPGSRLPRVEGRGQHDHRPVRQGVPTSGSTPSNPDTPTPTSTTTPARRPSKRVRDHRPNGPDRSGRTQRRLLRRRRFDRLVIDLTNPPAESDSIGENCRRLPRFVRPAFRPMLHHQCHRDDQHRDREVDHPLSALGVF